MLGLNAAAGAMPKIYLHYEGDLGPEHTSVWQQGRGVPFTERSLADALSAFVRSYESKHGREAYSGGMIVLLLLCFVAGDLTLAHGRTLLSMRLWSRSGARSPQVEVLL